MNRLISAGGWLLIVLLLGGCSPADSAPPAPAPTPAPAIQAILAASTLAVGPNRLPIGIVADGTPINDPQTKVHLRFFYLDDGQASSQAPAGETDALYFGTELPFGVYVAYPDFPKAGGWGVEVQITRPGQPTSTSKLRLDVLASDPTPALGSQAIPFDSPSLSSVDDPRKLSSASAPYPGLYQLTVAEALKQSKPLALLFATPGFCKTAVCGPSIEVLRRIQQQYDTRMNVIHVESYAYPYAEAAQANPPRLAPGMEIWQLQSEPWLFLIDATGTIRYKYEGGITLDELNPVLEALFKAR